MALIVNRLAASMGLALPMVPQMAPPAVLVLALAPPAVMVLVMVMALAAAPDKHAARQQVGRR